MRPLMIFAVLATLLPAAASANSFRAYNDLTVLPQSNSTFEVVISRGEGARGVWCAAADYAVRALGFQGRIYVLEARAASRTVAGRNSVIFTTNVNVLPQGPSRSVSVTTSDVGNGLPVNHAIQFCRGNNIELGDRILFRK
jgi:hypothetical protein